MFAIAEEIDENYTNVRIIVTKLRLNEVGCVFASDLKLINCEGEMTLTLGVLRTFRSLQFWHQKLMEDAGQSRNPEDFIKKNQKNYMNVVNESMLTGDPDTPILFTIPLPELHLLMGLVNWALVFFYKRVDKDELQLRMRTKSISVHG